MSIWWFLICYKTYVWNEQSRPCQCSHDSLTNTSHTKGTKSLKTGSEAAVKPSISEGKPGVASGYLSIVCKLSFTILKTMGRDVFCFLLWSLTRWAFVCYQKIWNPKSQTVACSRPSPEHWFAKDLVSTEVQHCSIHLSWGKSEYEPTCCSAGNFLFHLCFVWWLCPNKSAVCW